MNCYQYADKGQTRSELRQAVKFLFIKKKKKMKMENKFAYEHLKLDEPSRRKIIRQAASISMIQQKKPEMFDLESFIIYFFIDQETKLEIMN